MTDARLTEELARSVMGWRPALGRFLKVGRGWIPTSRFAPLVRIDAAFLVLRHAADGYELRLSKAKKFNVQVRIGSRTGEASGDSEARTITLAIARALGIDTEEDR